MTGNHYRGHNVSISYFLRNQHVQVGMRDSYLEKPFDYDYGVNAFTPGSRSEEAIEWAQTQYERGRHLIAAGAPYPALGPKGGRATKAFLQWWDEYGYNNLI